MNDENYMLSYETLMEYTSFWALSISEMSNRDMTMGISSDDVVGVNACKWNEISDLWLPNLKREFAKEYEPGHPEKYTAANHKWKIYHE